MTADLTPEESATLAQMVTRRITALKRAKEYDATGGFDDLGTRPQGVWDTHIATYTTILNKLENTP